MSPQTSVAFAALPGLAEDNCVIERNLHFMSASNVSQDLVNWMMCLTCEDVHVLCILCNKVWYAERGMIWKGKEWTYLCDDCWTDQLAMLCAG